MHAAQLSDTLALWDDLYSLVHGGSTMQPLASKLMESSMFAKKRWWDPRPTTKIGIVITATWTRGQGKAGCDWKSSVVALLLVRNCARFQIGDLFLRRRTRELFNYDDTRRGNSVKCNSMALGSRWKLDRRDRRIPAESFRLKKKLLSIVSSKLWYSWIFRRTLRRYHSSSDLHSFAQSEVLFPCIITHAEEASVLVWLKFPLLGDQMENSNGKVPVEGSRSANCSWLSQLTFNTAVNVQTKAFPA